MVRKIQFELRLLSMTAKQLSYDVAVDPYKEKFKQTIEELGVAHDQVYNADARVKINYKKGCLYKILSNEDNVIIKHNKLERCGFSTCKCLGKFKKKTLLH